jgi:hypothetical protein
MVSTQFDDILTQALQLPPDERIALIERLAASFRNARPAATPDESFSEEELAELLHVEPLPPAEIVAAGLLGTWADLGIEDGAAWVNEQKRQQNRG